MKTFLNHLTDTLGHDMLIDLARACQDPYRDGYQDGYSGLTYTADCVMLYDMFEDEIWDALRMDAEDLGYDNVVEFCCTFRTIGYANTQDLFKAVLVQHMAEREAQRYADACEHDEEVA